VFAPDKRFQPNIVFVEEHLKGVQLKLLSNIKIGWKVLQKTNALAYYAHFVNCGCKKVYNIAPLDMDQYIPG
jgi:hypothetical protein